VARQLRGQDNALYNVDSSFPKGRALSQWLSTVGALTGSQINLTGVAESVGMVKAPTQRWIYNSAQDPQQGMTDDTKHLSFLTPVGGGIPSMSDTALAYCGRAIFSDLHAGGSPTGSIPGVCAGPPLSAQLKALEFLFFDLSACVSVDTQPPPPPPPEPPK
jgi:hypothetical protein